MSEQIFPPLCGGVFFRILINHRRARLERRALYAGTSDSRSNNPVLIDLIHVTAPSYEPPIESTLNTCVSNFLNCRTKISHQLPFKDPGFIASFRSQMDTDYLLLLYRMSFFLNYIIDISEECRRNAIIRELAEIIDHDPTCANAEFCVGPNGESHSIKDLSNVSFQSFILGIWYYIVSAGPENKLDNSLYDAWRDSSRKGETVERKISSIEQNVDEPPLRDTGADTVLSEESNHTEEDENSANPKVEIYETPYTDPATQKQVVAQFHVEAKDNGIAIGQVFGGLVIGKRGDKDE